MPNPYLGEIRMFAGQFAPQGWADCSGQLLPISQFDALFSLIGTTYGGDGRSTLGLPDLRGRVPIHYGSGPGLTPRALGVKSGQELHTLTLPQLPVHSHTLRASGDPASELTPAGNLLASNVAVDIYNATPTPAALSDAAPPAITNAGGGQPHNNMQNFLTIRYIIALFGIYPSQS